jgi:putative zinc finger/helix-turn-helix YgiT family protein
VLDEQSQAKHRPFPWQCPTCLKREVFPTEIPYSAEIKHDGALHTIHVSHLAIPKCTACGELIFSDWADDQVSAALRLHLHLLTPGQIGAGREGLSLEPRQLAEQLGVAEETLARWESGALIQSRAMDNLLRIYFNFPDVRSALGSGSLHPACV